MKKFTIHGQAKGKTLTDAAPAASIWADDEADAVRRGRNILRMNPIHQAHFSDVMKVKEDN